MWQDFGTFAKKYITDIPIVEVPWVWGVEIHTKTMPLLHRVSIGVFKMATGRNPLFHGFHSPYYYYDNRL